MTYDLSRVRHVVLDMDGTIYLGGTLFTATRPFLGLLRELEIGYTFVTNNDSHSHAQYVAKLEQLGIAATTDMIFTSADATIHHLREQLPEVRRLFVLGTAGLEEDLRDAGFEVDHDHPQAVVVGFDSTLSFDRLARCGHFLSQGLPYVATHPDFVCPTDQPLVLPDCGAICALLETATGRKPDAVPGKPNPLMLHGILSRSGLKPHEIAMVGDRLYTDVRMARDAGACAVLTLTGEAKPDDLKKVAPQDQPNVVVADLAEFGRLLREARGLEQEA